ncbi:Ig-like domain-containing protein, partial [Methanobrevibacter curvatus]|uniref:Ig-like domain-containing protein n=1 Tax=Methanobrevibacter curvatus TaxID=49547 RepID=UPI000AB0B875
NTASANSQTTIYGTSFVNNTATGLGNAVYAGGRINASFNRFFNNNETPADVNGTIWTNTSQFANVNINSNWWGNNTPTTTGVSPSNWIVLNVSGTPGNVTLSNRTAYVYYYLRLFDGSSLYPFTETNLNEFNGTVNDVVLASGYDYLFDASKSHYVGIAFTPYGWVNGTFEVDWWRSTFNVSTISDPNITSPNVSGKYKNVTVLNATITDSAGYVLSNLTVNFYINGVLVGSNVTDVNGFAFYVYTATSAGNFTYVAEYSGNDVNFNPMNSTRNASFDKRGTVISPVNVTGNALDTVYLNATIVDEYGEVVSNVPIQFGA